jgi:uncharacterized protein (TIGR02391 family)
METFEDNAKTKEEDKLVLKFEPSTIEHLGVKMYSHIPPALAELVANSYDACAKVVHVKLYNGDDKRIVVEDDGSGMSFDEINNYFLRIGRNRRKEHQESPCGRKPTGKKGLGKLALFGLGTVVQIITIKDDEKVTFILNYDDILQQEGEYTPGTNRDKVDVNTQSGTTITLRNLKHQSEFSAVDYSISLARLFNFKDDGVPPFNLFISLDDNEPIKIDNKLKYDNINSEFEWDKSAIIKLTDSTYDEKEKIKGKIITTEKPLTPGLRGITLFANGRMVNSPEFFGQSESSHFFSYTTGWLDIDFVDEWSEDVISTNRQSIDWENPKTLDLKKFLGQMLVDIEKDWRVKRKDKRNKDLQEKTDIDIEGWISKLPPNVKESIELLLKNVERSELTSDQQSTTVKTIHGLVPEYPNFHWRHLNPIIREASKDDYERQDYYRAFIEAAKRYITATRDKSGSVGTTDAGMMGAVYGRGKTLSVTSKYKKPDGTDFHTDTLEGIEEGQKFLSMGILSGGRNPISHEEIKDLRESGLFSEKDCLDGLSLLSHLYNRLESC